MTKPKANELVVCVHNEGFSASLEKRKIYVALRDAGAQAASSGDYPRTSALDARAAGAKSPRFIH